MKAVKARITRGLQKGSMIHACDNSGAKVLRIISFSGGKGVKGRNMSGGVGDLITASVWEGNPEMRKKVVQAIIVRQAREFRRKDGMRIKFESNAAVVLKDDKGNPKGTIIKGPIAKEIVGRWPTVAKLAKVVV